MKMHKLFGKRGFAVFTSLALCASLVAPSFAATLTELQNATKSTGGANGGHEFTTDEGQTRYGYGSQNAGKYGVEAWDEGGVRNVVLNEEVSGGAEKGGVVIHSNEKVVLDLNGHTVEGQFDWDATIVVRGGDLTIKDSSQAETGTVTGGKFAGVWVEVGAVDSNGNYVAPGTPTYNECDKVSGHFTLEGGTIEGNNSHSNGDEATSSGVGVKGEGNTFTMSGGAIKNNNGDAPGVVVDGAEFKMSGGTIESNATGNKDGVSLKNGGSLEMSGGSILVDEGANALVTDGVEGTSAVVKGGTFSEKPDAYIAEGYESVDNGDGTWTVKAKSETEQPGSGSETERPAPTPAPAPVTPLPTNPALIVSDGPVIEIDEPAVPLAEGPVTCGEFVDYLWRHEDEPEVEVVGDHEFAPAISWAHSIGIIPDEGFNPDELVTVSFVREILTNFALYSDMVMPELTSLKGDEDEAVLNCHEVLAEFYGEAEVEAEAEAE